MINWRNIKDVGYPKDSDKKYLVTDGYDISTTDIQGTNHYKGGGNDPIFTFKGWSGDDNTYDDNSCCSGTPMIEY